MQEESDLDLEKAHRFALSEFNKHDEGVLVFEFNGKTYLSKFIRSKLKTKLIFEAVVKAIGHKYTGTSENPAKDYLFEVISHRIKTVSKQYFTPREMHSETRFSNKLMGMVPFLRFLGNSDDFSQYIFSECRRMLNSDTQISTTGCSHNTM